MHKILAWALSFFIVVGSFSVSKMEVNISLIDTAKISTEALVTQFFYISTLPLNVIAKLFVETENSLATPLAPVKDSKKSSGSDNAAQASSGYSIIPVTNLIQFTKVKNNSFKKFQNKLSKINFVAIFCDIFCRIGLFSIEILQRFNVMVLLLLAILLTRRNIGDDNIIFNIKNNTFARLV